MFEQCSECKKLSETVEQGRGVCEICRNRSVVVIQMPVKVWVHPATGIVSKFVPPTHEKVQRAYREKTDVAKLGRDMIDAGKATIDEWS